MNGKAGYSIAGNGRSILGSFLRNVNKLSMETMYITIAPNTDMVIRLAVSVWPPKVIRLSLKMATMPTTPPAIMARCGVLNLACTAEK